MYLILGSALDDQPYRLAQRWLAVGRDATVGTPADLSRPGWRYRSGQPHAARAACGERLLHATDMDAVVSLLPWVSPADLPHVIDRDREYVAQEMSAFLLAWLHKPPCRVVDPPSTTSLAGCGRSALEWAALARRAGVAADPSWSGPVTSVTVVGARATPDTPAELAQAAERVAALSGRNLVTLRFIALAVHDVCAPVLTGAQVRPEVGSPSMADALLEWLEAG